MKVTQIESTAERKQAAHLLTPATRMSGIQTVTLSNESISVDFLGFGVALTGSSCYLLSQMEDKERTRFLKSIYTAEGLNLSVARLTVGSSDYSAELYSYDDCENDRSLSQFSIERDLAYVIPMIREVLAVKPDLYLFASPWSPPGWMKTGGSLCGGYMRREFVDCYADYVVRYLKEYEQQGIHISAITPQNEPETQQKGRMPACIWHPDVEAAFIVALRKRLDAEHMDVRIWMHDHNYDGVERVRWMLQEHAGLAESVDGVAFHYYSGDVSDTEPLAREHPTLVRHFTEGGPRLYDHYDSDWCKWGAIIARTLNAGFGSLTGWNLLLDEMGGPNVGPFFCGGLVTRNSQTRELSFSGQYQAFWHLSHFMQRGARVIKSSIDKNQSGFFGYPKVTIPAEVLAVQNPNRTCVLLLVNPDEKKRQVQFELEDGWRYAELLPNSISTVLIEQD